MISKSRWHVRDKWKRHLALAGHGRLMQHIPPTKLLNRANLRQFLQRYNVLFLKPVHGSFGNNIIKVTRRRRAFLVHHENRVQRVLPGNLARHLARRVNGRRYLLQKGVSLIRVNGRPADFRVLLLKPGSRWEVMGTMGKVATGNRIVTNFNHGGRPMRLREALRRAGWNDRDIQRVRMRMYQVGLMAARQFNRRYTHCRRLGIDFAIDMNKRIWILEVNTNPFYELFRFHENRHLYAKIHGYMKRIRMLQSDY